MLGTMLEICCNSSSWIDDNTSCVTEHVNEITLHRNDLNIRTFFFVFKQKVINIRTFSIEVGPYTFCHDIRIMVDKLCG